LDQEEPAKPLYIYYWSLGVLNTYRPPGQTSWSKALVRLGADPRVALAEVLGVPVADIRVREGVSP
jgi:hypothetical protein